jgi:hypothetical protein
MVHASPTTEWRDEWTILYFLVLVHAVREEQEQGHSMLHSQQNGEMKKKSTTVVKKGSRGIQEEKDA